MAPRRARAGPGEHAWLRRSLNKAGQARSQLMIGAASRAPDPDEGRRRDDGKHQSTYAHLHSLASWADRAHTCTHTHAHTIGRPARRVLKEPIPVAQYLPRCSRRGPRRSGAAGRPVSSDGPDSTAQSSARALIGCDAAAAIEKAAHKRRRPRPRRRRPQIVQLVSRGEAGGRLAGTPHSRRDLSSGPIRTTRRTTRRLLARRPAGPCNKSACHGAAGRRRGYSARCARRPARLAAAAAPINK
jgi:hypothetical protein